MIRPVSRVSNIASKLSRAESITRTGQILRQWRNDGTLGSNINQTLRNEFSKPTSSPTPHPDVPALSNLTMLEPRAGVPVLSVQAIKVFIGPPSLWEENYSKAAHTWKTTENLFGDNYKTSVRNLDPTPLQSFLRKHEKRSVERQSQASEVDQGSVSGEAESKEKLLMDQELDVLAEQVMRQISFCLDKDMGASKVSTEG